MTHNPNCDGAHCQSESGEVRLYRLGGSSNVILCFDCWAHENRCNFERGRETGAPENWPQQNWYAAKVYDAS